MRRTLSPHRVHRPRFPFLVERRAHERDRRAVEIALTETGKGALLALVQQALDAQDALLSSLPDYLRPVFLKCLQILADAEDAVA